MSEDRDLLAEAAAHFAKASVFWRDWRFMLEIEEERRQDFVRVLLQQRGVRIPGSA
jgi:hypothetical protein